MKTVLAAVLVVIAVIAGVIAYGPLHNLWADYQDSATSTYLLFGLPPLAVCLAALVGAAMLIRRA